MDDFDSDFGGGSLDGSLDDSSLDSGMGGYDIDDIPDMDYVSDAEGVSGTDDVSGLNDIPDAEDISDLSADDDMDAIPDMDVEGIIDDASELPAGDIEEPQAADLADFEIEQSIAEEVDEPFETDPEFSGEEGLEAGEFAPSSPGDYEAWKPLGDVPFAGDVQSEVSEAVEETQFPGRVYDQFEENVQELRPGFYETGEYYEQGVNSLGYEGTCGPTTLANSLNKTLDTNVFTEENVLEVAVENGLCETGSSDPAALGGTTTEQFMDLCDKISESTGGAFSAECFEYDDALDAEQVAAQLEQGNSVSVAVDSKVLWDEPREYYDDAGVRVVDSSSDHWITVQGVQRDAVGNISGFDIVDSGGGVSSVSLDKYNEMCFGSDSHKVLDPTCVVLSKEQIQQKEALKEGAYAKMSH